MRATLPIERQGGGRDPATSTARDVMSMEVSCCFDDQNVDDAVHIMEPALSSTTRTLVPCKLRSLIGNFEPGTPHDPYGC